MLAGVGSTALHTNFTRSRNPHTSSNPTRRIHQPYQRHTTTTTTAFVVFAASGQTKRRRLIIKRRLLPRRADRHKQRYRDDPGLLPDLNPDSPRYAGRLTSEINSCNGPQQMAALVVGHGRAMSGAQLSQVLARLAGFATWQALTPEQAAAQSRAARRVALLLAPLAPDLEPPSAARAAYCLARLGLYDADLASALVSGVTERLHLLPPPGLAALVGGLAGVGHVPPPGWLDRFALEVYTRFSHFNATELAAVLYGMVRLQYRPSDAWLARCLEVFRAATAAAAAPAAAGPAGEAPAAAAAPPPLGPAMVRFAFALASLQVRPSFNWCSAFVGRVRPLLDSLSARELAVLLWALARMTATTAPAATAVTTAAPPAAPATASARGSGGGGGGGGAQPSQPPPPAQLVDRGFLESWFRCSARRVGSASGAALVLALQALAALQVFPAPAKYVTAVLPALRELMPASPPPASPLADGSCGGSTSDGADGGSGGGGDIGDASGGGAADGAAAERRQRLSGAEAVSVLLSLVGLRIRPDPDWMEACLGGLQPLLPSLPAALLADLVWALARLRYQPSGPWLAALCARLEDQLELKGGGGLGGGTGGGVQGRRSQGVGVGAGARGKEAAAVAAGLEEEEGAGPAEGAAAGWRRRMRGSGRGGAEAGALGGEEGVGEEGGGLSGPQRQALAWALRELRVTPPPAVARMLAYGEAAAAAGPAAAVAGVAAGVTTPKGGGRAAGKEAAAGVRAAGGLRKRAAGGDGGRRGGGGGDGEGGAAGQGSGGSRTPGRVPKPASDAAGAPAMATTATAAGTPVTATTATTAAGSTAATASTAAAAVSPPAGAALQSKLAELMLGPM